jgi:hypothetical protein
MTSSPEDLLLINNAVSLQDEEQEALTAAAFEHKVTIQIVQRLGGGFSGAALFLAQARSVSDKDSADLVIIKVDRLSKKKNESDRFAVAKKSFSANFTDNHFVELPFQAVNIKKVEKTVIFYSIAGLSLTDYRPLRSYTQPRIISIATLQLTQDLIDEWSSQDKKIYHQPKYLHEVVQDFFATRYTVKTNSIGLFLEDKFSLLEDDGILVTGQVFPNPLRVLSSNQLLQEERKFYLPLSPQHGDLNTGNILLSNPRTPDSVVSYFLVDLIHFQERGSFIFDLVSLEVGLIFDFFTRSGLSVRKYFADIIKLGVLTGFSPNECAVELQGVLQPISVIRSAIETAIKQYAGSYYDDWYFSLAASGIAVGLITANTKGLDDELRTLGFLYAAAYLKSYMNKIGAPITENRAVNIQLKKEQVAISDEPLAQRIKQQIRQFIEACNNFSQDRVYVGLFGSTIKSSPEYIIPLARIRWSAIIDFNPNTEQEGGLLSTVKAPLSESRYIHLVNLGNEPSEMNPEKGCYWFAANGLDGQGNSLKDVSWRTWNRNRSVYLEQFLDKLSTSTIKPVSFLIFWDNSEFVEDVARMAERYFRDRVSFVLACPFVEALQRTVDRYEMNDFNLGFEHISAGILDFLPDTSGLSDEIMLPAHNSASNHSETRIIPHSIFNWIEEECTVVHFNIGMIQDDLSGENNNFLRGGRITWFDLNVHSDIDRDLTRGIHKQVESDLNGRETTRIRIYHHPGAGGSTVACRVLWELHWTYPSIVVNSISEHTIQRVRDIYTRTGQAVLALIDSGTLTNAQIDAFYDSARAAQIPIVLLIVSREFDLPNQSERVFPLDKILSARDSGRFFSVLSKEVPARSKALEAIVLDKQSPERRTPFYFGLTAFEDDFLGIEIFVRARLVGITETERKIIVLASIAHYFGQQSVSAQMLAPFLGLPLSRTVDLKKYLQLPRRDLVIRDELGWRPIHYLVAEEILIQLLSGNKEREQWIELLSEYAVEIIEMLGDASEHIGQDLNEDIRELLRNLFVERAGQSSFEASSSKFSVYIEKIPTVEGKRRVFDALVRRFPDEAHFWGHRSRLIWRYATDVSEFEEALDSINRAIAIGSEYEDHILHHIKGMALSKWTSYLMDRVSHAHAADQQTADNETILTIKQLFDEALAVFRYIREQIKPTEERAYVSAIELITRHIEFQRAISPYATFAELFASANARVYLQYLTEAENLLDQVRRIRVGESRESFFIEERRIYLNRIYDNQEAFIQGLWNLLDKQDVYRPQYRRNIVYAYLARSDRDWDKLPRDELARIKDLMEQNLVVEPGNNHNVRLWFDASRRLPSTSISSSIEQLTYWVNNAGALDLIDATYYLYVLHAITAIEGSELGSTQAQRFLQRCKELAQERPNRTFSLDWLGKGKGVSRLISHSKLGKFDDKLMFFKNTNPLDRLTGRIDRIMSPQAGRIKAFGLDLFFTPSSRAGHQFVAGRNDNESVTFFLGFSYDGLRAWDVHPMEASSNEQTS